MRVSVNRDASALTVVRDISALTIFQDVSQLPSPNNREVGGHITINNEEEEKDEQGNE